MYHLCLIFAATASSPFGWRGIKCLYGICDREQPKVGVFMRIAKLLMDSHYAENGLIQSLVLSRSASEKLSRLLLGWSASHGQGEDRFQIGLTHEEIGEMIGVTRETVTRLLNEFKNRQVLAIKGATVTIRNRAGLESLASPLA